MWHQTCRGSSLSFSSIDVTLVVWEYDEMTHLAASQIFSSLSALLVVLVVALYRLKHM